MNGNTASGACCSDCTPAPPPPTSCTDDCCASPPIDIGKADNVMPSSCADSSLDQLECCGVPEPNTAKSGCCSDTSCSSAPKKVVKDDCCPALTTVDECCATENVDDCCSSSPAPQPPTCSTPCCIDNLPTCCPPRPIQDACCTPKLGCPSPSYASSTLPSRARSQTPSSAAPIVPKPSARARARRKTSLPARCYNAMCCCARSVQKRLSTSVLGCSARHGHGHHHHHHSDGHGHDHSDGHSHDHSDHHDHGHDHLHEIEIETKAPEQDEPGRHELVLSVLGMDCPSCSPRVVRALMSMPSVAQCTVDVFAGRATVTYHPDRVRPDDMTRNVTASTGFMCDVLEDRVVRDVEQGESRRRMRVKLGRPSSEKGLVVEGVFVREERGDVIELEYQGNPRDVLTALAPWDPTYVPPAPASQADSAQREVVRLLKLTTISAALCIPVLVLAWAPLPSHPTIYGAISLVLTTLIQVYAARPIYVSGIRALVMQHTLDMDLLVSISTFTAFMFSVVAYACAVAGKPIGDGETSYFETAALLVTLVMLGRLIAAYARRRSTNAAGGLGAMQVEEAVLVMDGNMEQVIPVGLIHVGDVLRVRPGDKIPTDGRVEAVGDGDGGETHVDESAITGESVPVAKRTGAVLVAGTTVVTTGAGLDMRVTVSPDANTLARMGELMRAAQGARLKVQDTADRVAGWLAPVVLVLGIVTFVGWIGYAIGCDGQKAGQAVVRAIGYAVAVLVVSCPCAIALCVPMVAVIAVAVGTRRGVLFKTVEALESTCDVEVVAFDKTGTLTLGKLAVGSSSYDPWWKSERDVQLLVRALTASSTHPVSAAVHEHVIAALGTDICGLDAEVKIVPGKGVETAVDGVLVRGGSVAWAGTDDQEGDSTVFVVSASVDEAQTRFKRIAHFTLSDRLRPDAVETVHMLLQRGIEVYLLSGDVPGAVRRTATALSIPDGQALGGCTPEKKGEWIQSLQQLKSRKRKVMFIGDGTNDALALVQADVGVSLGGGTDVASSAAQIVLVSSLFSGLSDVFALAKAARRRVWINFAWSGVYNLVAILLASGVLGKARIPPDYAGLGELVSVLPVVAVAWSLGVVGW
ncbi:copper(2+) exporting ATPase [Ceratobasidium sp. AG-Ba]|nr:copper(2+) exporting ATPase [Ceratobasidium sp. AG-Ba]QRW03307.1 copper(2+) exporting ATPase [Ceratobasidium sp. AG-Ba]